MTWEPTNEEMAELAQLWTRDPAEKQFRFDPKGTRWFCLSHQLWLRPRTQVHHFYRWTRWYEGTSEGMGEGTALDRDASPGLRQSPRKMWLNGWEIAKKDTGRLKSTLPPPQNYIFLSSLDQDAEILSQPSILSVKVRLGAFVFAGVSLLGSVASIAALLLDLF